MKYIIIVLLFLHSCSPPFKKGLVIDKKDAPATTFFGTDGKVHFSPEFFILIIRGRNEKGQLEIYEMGVNIGEYYSYNKGDSIFLK